MIDKINLYKKVSGCFIYAQLLEGDWLEEELASILDDLWYSMTSAEIEQLEAMLRDKNS